MTDNPMKPTEGTGLAPNIASLLCYICSPITSIIFLLIEKENADVKFHAWQGTAFGVAVIALNIVLRIFEAIMGALASFLGELVQIFIMLFSLAVLILWIVCMIKAYKGERWKIPVLGDFAAKKAGV